MINDIQIASDKFRRANCKECRRKIMPLEIRGVEENAYDGYLCEKCSREQLKNIPNRLKEIINKLNEFSKMSDDEKRKYLNRFKILKKLQ